MFIQPAIPRIKIRVKKVHINFTKLEFIIQVLSTSFQILVNFVSLLKTDSRRRVFVHGGLWKERRESHQPFDGIALPAQSNYLYTYERIIRT